MQLTCSQCGAEFAVDDRWHPAGGAVQCPRCQSFVPAAADGRALPPGCDAPTVELFAPPAATALGHSPKRTPLASAMVPGARVEEDGDAAGAPVRCRGCGAVLADPVLAALGMCDSCREQQRQGRVPAPEWDPHSGAPFPVVGESELRVATGEVPLDGSEPVTDLDIAADDQRFGDSDLIEMPPELRPVQTVDEPTAPPYRPARRSSLPRSVATALAVALAGLAAVALLRHPWNVEFRRHPSGSRGPVLPVLEYKLDTWRAATSTLQGGVTELVDRGKRLALEDRPASYRQAANCFQRALVLDPTNLDAAARWVEVAVLARGERFDADEALFVRELLGQVLAANPGLAVAHRAKTQLLVLGGRFEEARAAAEEAYRRSAPDERAVALLAWGRTYLTQSAPIAQEKFESALQLDPSLKAALYYQGVAAENAGRYARAIDAYERRLALDPEHRDAVRGLLRVYQVLGEEADARAVLARSSGVLPGHEAPLLAAELSALGGRFEEAERALRGLLAGSDLSNAERKAALVQAAAVARQRGRLDAAAGLVHDALALAPRDPAASFQGMLVALAQRDAPRAQELFAACEEKIGDAARALEYRGRVAFVEGDHARASASFRKAIELAPGRLSSYLLEAASRMRAGDEAAAAAVMRRALDLDPSALAQRRRATGAFYEPAVEAIRLARGAFSPKWDARWPGVYEAVVAYHLGDSARASALFDRVLKSDSTSPPALIYRAQIEVDAGHYDRALRFAERAARSELQSAVARYLVGRAHDGLQHAELARAGYYQALQQDPGLAAPLLRLAVRAQAGGRSEEARDHLMKALAGEPDSVEVRQQLFRLGY